MCCSATSVLGAVALWAFGIPEGEEGPFKTNTGRSTGLQPTSSDLAPAATENHPERGWVLHRLGVRSLCYRCFDPILKLNFIKMSEVKWDLVRWSETCGALE